MTGVTQAVALSLLLAGSLGAQAQRIPPVDAKIAKLVPAVPTPASFVADGPGVIPGSDRTEIDARIRALQNGGYGDVGVAILPSIGDYQPYEVGLAIYRTWKIGSIDRIGSARRDVGVLLLIVPKELAPDQKGQCWISTGTGAEGIITDALSHSICTEAIVPFLRNREYGPAVLAGVDAIGSRLKGDAGLAASGPDPVGAEPIPLVQEPSKGGIRWWHVVGTFLLGLLGIRGGFWWKRNRPRRCPKCGKQMHHLTETLDDEALDSGQQMEEKLRSVDYDVWRCSCGGTFIVPYQAIFTKYHECASCHKRTAWTTRTILTQPTYTSKGRARVAENCKFCQATSTKEVSVPKLTRSSSSSGGGSSGSSGGGSSFGGSGSSSGGGGGSSY